MLNRQNPIDTRPLVGVYSTCGSKRDRRAVELLSMFCLINGLHCIFYLDKKVAQDEHPPAWDRLCQDIAEGKFQAGLTWLDTPDMEQWCAERGVKWVQVDVFGWFQAMRTSNKDMVRFSKPY